MPEVLKNPIRKPGLLKSLGIFLTPTGMIDGLRPWLSGDAKTRSGPLQTREASCRKRHLETAT